MLTRKEMEAELERDTAYSRINDGNYSAMDGIDRTRTFHEAMGLPVRSEPAIPSVSERILRARLLLEETMETIEKGLGLACKLNMAGGRSIQFSGDDVVIFHEEGVKYDPIETLDGLADVKVIANGTAVQFGLPLHEAEYEVWASNMTKLDEWGHPIHNVCNIIGCEYGVGECENDDHLVDSTKPRGKVLKPATYVPANIVRIFVRFAGDEDEALNRAWLLGHGEVE